MNFNMARRHPCRRGSAAAWARIEPQARGKPGTGLFAIERKEVIFALEPVLKLISILRAAAVTRLALRIDHPQAGRCLAEVAEHAKTGADRRLKIGTAPRVTDRRCVAAHTGS